MRKNRHFLRIRKNCRPVKEIVDSILWGCSAAVRGGQMGVEDEDTQCPDIHGIEVDVCIAFTKFWHGLHAIEQGAHTALALASSNM